LHGQALGRWCAGTRASEAMMQGGRLPRCPRCRLPRCTGQGLPSHGDSQPHKGAATTTAAVPDVAGPAVASLWGAVGRWTAGGRGAGCGRGQVAPRGEVRLIDRGQLSSGQALFHLHHGVQGGPEDVVRPLGRVLQGHQGRMQGEPPRPTTCSAPLINPHACTHTHTEVPMTEGKQQQQGPKAKGWGSHMCTHRDKHQHQHQHHERRLRMGKGRATYP
jgi:hypothetical protein